MDYSPDNPFIDLPTRTRYLRKRKNVMLRSYEVFKIAKEHKMLLSSDDMRVILNHSGSQRLGSSRGLNKGDCEVSTRQVGQYLGYMHRKGIVFRIKDKVYNIYSASNSIYKLYGLQDVNKTGNAAPIDWKTNISSIGWKTDEKGNFSIV